MIRKVLIIAYCFISISKSQGKCSQYNYCCRPNEQVYLKVFNANIWGLSYFNDEPNPSPTEPYDIESVRESLVKVIWFLYD